LAAAPAAGVAPLLGPEVAQTNRELAPAHLESSLATAIRRLPRAFLGPVFEPALEIFAEVSMQLSAFLVRGLYACLQLRGGGAERAFLAAAGLSEAQLARVNCFVDLAPVLRARRLVISNTSGGSLSGLEVASSAPLKTLGALGALLTNSPTLRGALQELEAYFGLFTRTGSLRCSEDAGLTTVMVQLPASEAAPERLALEYLVALIVRLSRELLGAQLNPACVTLPFSRPEHAGAYAAFFRCPVVFGGEQASVVFRSELLDEPAPLFDETWWAMLKSQVEASLVPALPRVPVHRRVSVLLRDEFPLREANRKAVAKRLGISVRSLLRQLEKEGKSFFKLVDDARRDAAVRLLVEGDEPLKAISDHLGFSEPSAFHRAFKRWTGETPQRYKAQSRVSLALAS
jgi:AraC-like DNA-binding protein